MAQTYTRQSSIADGDTITASLFNDEYNQLLNAFVYSSSSASATGHRHDGTTAQGGNIHTIGDLDFLNKILVTGNTWEFYVEVSSAAAKQMVLQDGALVPNADSDLDLGTSSVYFKDAFIDSITTTGNVAVGGNLTVTGTTTFNGGTLTLGDSAADNVVFGADVDSNIIPDDDGAYDLGSSSQEWRDLYIDGTAHIDTLDVDVNATIAGTLGVTGVLTGTSLDISGDIDVDGTTNLDVVDIDGAVDMASTLAVAGVLTGASLDISGDIDIDGTSNLDIVDIDGAVDMATTLAVGGEITAASLDISGNVDIDGTLETDALSLNGTAVTASAADLNLIDGITNGTVIASKALIADANIDITGGRNITISGELDAATLDISGDADIDGTLEADAITIAGVTLAETISDTVGAMVTSNTESGIAVAYQDADNTLDFTVGTLNQDTTGSAATLTTARTIGGVSFDGSANINLPGVNSAGNQNTSGTAALATTVTITDNESTNENNALIFTAGGDLDGGNLGLESDGDLKYNPSTGTLSATNISVSGTLSTVDSVTMSANNAVVFEGATADAHETTLTSVDATADRTITLPNVSGTVPVLAAASNTQITSTPEELNALDGITAVVGELNALDIGSTAVGTAVASKAVILDSNKDYTGLRNLTITGELDAATLDISGAIDVAGTSNLDVVDIDGAVDMASTLAVAGVLTANAGVVVDNFTLDGTTLALSSGDMTLDAAGDVILDAGGDDIKINSGGTLVHTISNNSGAMSFVNAINNKSILFKGVDADSAITALELDMSAAGAATFNSNVGIGGAAADPQGFGTALHIEGGTNSVLYLRDTDNSNYGYLGFAGGSDNRTTLTSFGTGYLQFATNNTERMRIDVSGNVGIGVTPEANWRSSVKAIDLGATGALWDGHNYTIIANNIYEHTDTDRKHKQDGRGSSIEQYLGETFFYRTTSGSADAVISATATMCLKNDGKVGINETAPLAPLHITTESQGTLPTLNGDADNLVIEDSTSGITLMGAANGGGMLAFGDVNDADVGRIFYYHADNSMSFRTAATERMRLTADGDMLVGATSLDGNAQRFQTNLNANNKFNGMFITEGNNANRFGPAIRCGTNDNSGTNSMLTFQDGDGTGIGGITSSGGTVTYGAFTAHHEANVPDADNPSDDADAYPYGTLVEVVTTYLSHANKQGSIRYTIQKSQSANSKKVLGAYASNMRPSPMCPTTGTYANNLHNISILGDGHILCNNSGGNIAVGDGICTSAVEGIGMKATANPSMIIGIAQEDVTFSGSETKSVAVQFGVQQFTPWS
ncbi:hypothetical protein PQZ52_01310 [Flavobacteriales bacterium]|nr:hypothetical protein [Flavobacteriales bacterium]